MAVNRGGKTYLLFSLCLFTNNFYKKGLREQVEVRWKLEKLETFRCFPLRKNFSPDWKQDFSPQPKKIFHLIGNNIFHPNERRFFTQLEITYFIPTKEDFSSQRNNIFHPNEIISFIPTK
jgi:hypothetical protein